MRKTLLLVVAAVLSCISAMAQWNSNNAENLLVWPDKNYYTSDMKTTPDGHVWLAVHHPFRNVEKDYSGVTVALQLIDSLGNFCFEEPIEYIRHIFLAYRLACVSYRNINLIVRINYG